MREKKNRASRGHGGIVFQRDLHESLRLEREHRRTKKLNRINRRRRPTPAQAGWLARFAKKLGLPLGRPRPVEPVETLNG